MCVSQGSHACSLTCVSLCAPVCVPCIGTRSFTMSRSRQLLTQASLCTWRQMLRPLHCTGDQTGAQGVEMLLWGSVSSSLHHKYATPTNR